MEDLIKRFVSSNSGDGYGSGSGYGYGSGYGSGDGSGYGSGYGAGYGDGDGYGSGYGYGSGDGNGYGYGNGDGYCNGNGDGSGYGYGIKSYCGEAVHRIDGVQTIIRSIRGDVAKGAILQSDLTLSPCYIVKMGNVFAHGDTLRKAMIALQNKLMEDMPVEERIEAFLAAHKEDKPYPNLDFLDWHYKLTGSCEDGRNAFVRDHDIDINCSMNVTEFIALTKGSYGGDVISELEKCWKEERGNEVVV